MSMYGNHTPAQDLKEAIDAIQAEFDLTDDQMKVVLARVLADKVSDYQLLDFDVIQRSGNRHWESHQ